MIIQNYSDSLISLLHKYKDWKYEKSDTLSNPYYFPIFYAKSFNSDLFFYKTDNSLVKEIQKQLLFLYTQTPWFISNNLSNVIINKNIIQQSNTKPIVQLSDKILDVDKRNTLLVEDIPLVVQKPSFWSFSNNISFQLMQNYVTENWYKGGENNHSFLASVNIQANYNNKRKITFNNKLEAKLGFQSSNSDSQHKYRTNADIIRLTNELGVKAIHHWDYSAMLQSWTQFSPGYKKNDTKVYSDFMSPFESLLTVGMKYSISSKNKKQKLGVNISPFACNFKYVNRLGLAKSFGIPEKSHIKFEYGGNITLNGHLEIMKNVIWDCRFFYFTNYKYTQIEWENNIMLKVNKYLSTRLFLYPRFDDSVRKKTKQKYFQFKEYLSLGLDIDF